MSESIESDTVEYIEPPALEHGTRFWPPTARVAVELGAATHLGKVRRNNEDSYLVARAERSLEVLFTNLPSGDVPRWATETAYGLIVADGMGGHAAGEVASQMALRTIVERVLATPDWIMNDSASHADKIEQRMVERIAQADEAVRDEASRNPGRAGMGTTLTVAVSSGSHLLIAHVGDSRAYLFRDGNLHRLTRDQSLAQALVDQGIISQEQAGTHRMRHVLLQALGGGNIAAEVRHVTLKSGDRLLLCTDGLTEMVSEPTIQEILEAADSVDAACDALVNSALAAGGRDNVTVVLARYAW